MKDTEQAKEKKVPEGYRENAKGHLVPEEAIPELEKLEDDLVREAFTRAMAARAAVESFRAWALDAARNFRALAAQEYHANKGSDKHLTLRSFDGKLRWTCETDDLLELDTVETATARSLIDECLEGWSRESRAEMVALVTDAFASRNGKLSAAKVWPLLRVESDDERWKRAQEILRRAGRPKETREYLRFHVREGKDPERLFFKC